MTKLVKLWLNKRLLIAGTLLCVMAYFHYLVSELPADFKAYAYGYQTFRGFAVDFVDVLSQLILSIAIMLVSRYKSFSSYVFFGSFIFYFYYKLFFQVLGNFYNSEIICMKILIACIIGSIIIGLIEKK